MLDQKRSTNLYDRRAKYYDITHHIQTLWADSYHRCEVVRKINSHSESIVLDIGCGTGLLSQKFIETQDYGLIIGVDSSMEMLKGFLRFINENGLKNDISIVQCNAEKLPLGDERIDNAISAYGIGGIPDINEAFNEIKRVVKKQGVICFAEMVTPPNNGFWKLIHLWIVHPIIKLLWEFRDISLLEYIVNSGFIVLDNIYFRNRILGSTRLVKAIKKKDGIK